MSDTETDVIAPTEAAVADDLIEGVQVTWTEDGETKTGTVVGIAGLTDDPPTIMVSVDGAPEDAEPIMMEIADVELVAVTADIEDEYVPTAWAIVDDHPECNANPDTTAPVGVVALNEDGSEGPLDSCHADEAAAQARIDELMAEVEDAAEPAEEVPDDDFPLSVEDGDSEATAEPTFVGEETGDADAPREVVEIVEPSNDTASTGNTTSYQSVGTVFVNVEPRIQAPTASGNAMAELERAAGLAASIRSTLDLLSSVSPDVTPLETVTVDKSFTDETGAEHEIEVTVEAAADEIEEATAAAETAVEVIEAASVAAQAASEEEVEIIPEVVQAALDDLAEGDSDLQGLSRDEMIDELARRFAEVAANLLKGEGVEFAPVEEVEPEEGIESETIVASDSDDFEWEGVLIVEGLPSGDGRMIAEGALTHRDLPLPLMLQTVNAAGHDGAVICGSIQKIERVGQDIMGYGIFDEGDAGQEAKRLLTKGTMRGVSADIDSVVVEFLAEDGTPVDFEEVMLGGVTALEVLVEGRIMGATLTPFPAFQEAYVSVIKSGETDEALVASGQTYQGDIWRVNSPGGVWAAGQRPADVEALVASASQATVTTLPVIPVQPPVEWFANDPMPEPVPFTIDANGRCFGLVAQFGSCHISFPDQCIDVPRTKSGYRHFRNKTTLCAGGEVVATGPLFINTVHPSLKMMASDAQAHYHDTGCAVADVALYENEWGIVAAGAARPTATPEQLRIARGSDWSPDWRGIDGNLEVVGVLAVNVSGFVVKSLVASGAEISQARGRYDSVSGEVTALVAAGMVHRKDVTNSELVKQVSELSDLVEAQHEVLERLVIAPERARRAAELADRFSRSEPAREVGMVDPARAERVAALTARFAKTDEADCGCDGHEGACTCEF